MLIHARSEPTLPALTRLRKYMRAAGRYGPSPFLVGHYGGTGEIAQGFCRAAAVSGAIYILGRRIVSISTGAAPPHRIDVEDVPDPLFCRLVIASPAMASLLPREWRPTCVPEAGTTATAEPIARCIAIVDFPIEFSSAGAVAEEGGRGNADQAHPLSPPSLSPPPPPTDTGILVFPPSSLPGGSTSRAATVLMTGESAMAAPRGKSTFFAVPCLRVRARAHSLAGQGVLYIALAMEREGDPKVMLKPYLDATLSLSSSSSVGAEGGPREPLLTTYYVEHPDSRAPAPATAAATATTPSQTTCLITPALRNDRLPEAPDLAAIHAERVFWEAVRVLQPEGPVESFWPAEAGHDEADEEADEW